MEFKYKVDQDKWKKEWDEKSYWRNRDDQIYFANRGAEEKYLYNQLPAAQMSTLYGRIQELNFMST